MAPLAPGPAPTKKRFLPDDLELSDCPLCGGSDGTPLLEAPDPLAPEGGPRFRIVRCSACELCFTNPRPTRTSIGRFYPDSYGPHQRAKASASRLRRERTIAWQGEGRLLDFGCGAGGFLQAMHRQGWQVTGLDISPTAIQHVREDLGLHGLAGTLPHPELEPGRFDVVTMWHALEHLHDPLPALRDVWRLLVPGGWAHIEVPNLASWGFARFGEAWYGLELPRHLTHFTPTSLQAMLGKAGFLPEPVSMVPRINWTRYSLELARRKGQSVHWERWLRRKWGQRLMNRYFTSKGQGEVIRIAARKPA